MIEFYKLLTGKCSTNDGLLKINRNSSRPTRGLQLKLSDQKWIETILSRGPTMQVYSRKYDIYNSKSCRYKEIYIIVVNIKSHRKLLAHFRMGMSRPAYPLISSPINVDF